MVKIIGKNVGDDFQTETMYIRTKSLGGNLDWANKPETYKSYPLANCSTAKYVCRINF